MENVNRRKEKETINVKLRKILTEMVKFVILFSIKSLHFRYFHKFA